MTIFYALNILNLLRLAWKHPKSEGYFKSRKGMENLDLFSRMIDYPIEKVGGLWDFLIILISRAIDLSVKVLMTIITFLKLETLFIFQVVCLDLDD